MRERLAALPGVREVGSSELPTLTGRNAGANITVEGRAQTPDDADVLVDFISPAYFSTLGVPLIDGRDFTAADSANGNKVAIINETLARHFFPNRNPIGLHLAFGGGAKVTPDRQIVGVIKDNRQDHVRSEMSSYVFIPYAQNKTITGMSFYVRTQQDPLLIADEMRGAVRNLDPNMPVYDLKTFDRVVDEDLIAERLIAAMSAGFGLLAGLLAALGIYGVLSYLVIQRTREIGIRIALGAEAREVRALIVKEVGFMVIAGAAIGLPAAYAFARLSESLLFGVHANNIGIYLLALTVITVIAAAACLVPVRRAIRVDPIIALRYE
jgi:predicted permease